MTTLLEEPKNSRKIGKQIQEISREIDRWRKQVGLSQDELVERYPDLGSRRTFLRGLRGELNETADLVRFRTVGNLKDLDDGEVRSREVIHDDFTAFLHAREAFIEMAKENGVCRFLPLLGHSGAGKTTFVNWMAKRYPGRVIIVEAIPAWQNCKGGGTDKALCEAILEKLGCRHIPVRGATLAKRTIEYLNRRRIAVVIEEAHELCGHGLMMIKAFINATQGEFVVTAHPRLWSDLQKQSNSACSQLTGNRLWELIDFDIRAEDVAQYFEREMQPFSAGKGGKPADRVRARMAACETIHRLAVPNGGWNFVKGVCRTLRRQKNKELTTAAVIKAANREVARR